MKTGSRKILLVTALLTLALAGCSTADKMVAPAPKPAPVAAPAPPPANKIPPPSYLVEGVNFDTGRATLKPTAMSQLDEVAAALVKHPEHRYQVNGHTDSVGSEASNQRLSERRAKAVQKYLISKGVDGSSSQVRSANGFGETDPVANNATKAGRAQNRRVEIKPIK
jgi:OOP family OmpA-OmpF porin